MLDVEEDRNNVLVGLHRRDNEDLRQDGQSELTGLNCENKKLLIPNYLHRHGDPVVC